MLKISFTCRTSIIKADSGVSSDGRLTNYPRQLQMDSISPSIQILRSILMKVFLTDSALSSIRTFAPCHSNIVVKFSVNKQSMGVLILVTKPTRCTNFSNLFLESSGI